MFFPGIPFRFLQLFFFNSFLLRNIFTTWMIVEHASHYTYPNSLCLEQRLSAWAQEHLKWSRAFYVECIFLFIFYVNVFSIHFVCEMDFYLCWSRIEHFLTPKIRVWELAAAGLEYFSYFMKTRKLDQTRSAQTRSNLLGTVPSRM